MMKKIIISTLICFAIIIFGTNAQVPPVNIKLIAHRGGVVDNTTPENSLTSLQKAAAKGYWMVEIDVRLTKDSVLITNHDNTFKKYFNIDRKVEELTWLEIKNLKSSFGTQVLTFEDVLIFCNKHRLNVMIDNKIQGFHQQIFDRMISLLNKYDLRKDALMIGTEESTEYFTGKVRLSCSKQQILNNMKRKDYSVNNYFLFENPDERDMPWLIKNKIMVVGIINEWAFKKDGSVMLQASEIAKRLINLKVEFVQLDSKFDKFFTAP